MREIDGWVGAAGERLIELSYKAAAPRPSSTEAAAPALDGATGSGTGGAGEPGDGSD